MPILNSATEVRSRHYLLVGCWLAFVVAAGSYFISARLVAFDPEQRLQSADNQEIVNQLAQLAKREGAFHNTLIHFSSPGCACNKVTAAHKKTVSERAASAGMRIVEIELDALPRQSLLSATPAILATDAQGRLLYFGPYATGLACSENNGLFETVLNNYQNGFNSELVVGDAKGCYCNT